MKTCKQSALVLPVFIGYEFIARLEKDHKVAAYMGKETFYEVNIEFAMRGIVPRYIVQRAKSAESCGLWKRWEDLFRIRFDRSSTRKTKPLQNPGMDGNVLVIFLTFLLCSILSVFCFVLEYCLVNIIYRYIKQVLILCSKIN